MMIGHITSESIMLRPGISCVSCWATFHLADGLQSTFRRLTDNSFGTGDERNYNLHFTQVCMIRAPATEKHEKRPIIRVIRDGRAD